MPDLIVTMRRHRRFRRHRACPAHQCREPADSKEGQAPGVGQGPRPPSALSVEKLTELTRALDRNVVGRLQAGGQVLAGLDPAALAGPSEASHAQLVLSQPLLTPGVEDGSEPQKAEMVPGLRASAILSLGCAHVRRPHLTNHYLE